MKPFQILLGIYLGWSLAFGYFGLPETPFFKGVCWGLATPLLAGGALVALGMAAIQK